MLIKNKASRQLSSLIVALLLVVLTVISFALTSCGEAVSSSTSDVTIVVPDGAPLLPMTSFAMGFEGEVKDGAFQFPDEINQSLGKTTKMQIVNGPDQLVSSIMNSKPELAIMPINLITKMYNDAKKDKNVTPYKLAGITTWGLNSIVSNTDTNTLEAIKGHKLYTYGKTETPGIVIRTLLSQLGIKWMESTDDNVKVASDTIALVNFTSASDISSQLIKEKNEPEVFAMLPEPVASIFVKKQSDTYKVSVNIQDVYKEQNGGKNYPMSGLAVRSDFAANNDNLMYLTTLLSTMELGSQISYLTPQNSVDMARVMFGSSMFSDTSDAAAESIEEGRLDVHYANVTGGIDSLFKEQNLESNRSALRKFLELLLNNSDFAGQIDGDIPEDDFYLHIDENSIISSNNTLSSEK